MYDRPVVYSRKWSARRKRLSHISQTKGRSSECVNLWRFKCVTRVKTFEHTSHWCGSDETDSLVCRVADALESLLMTFVFLLDAFGFGLRTFMVADSSSSWSFASLAAPISTVLWSKYSSSYTTVNASPPAGSSTDMFSCSCSFDNSPLWSWLSAFCDSSAADGILSQSCLLWLNWISSFFLLPRSGFVCIISMCFFNFAFRLIVTPQYWHASAGRASVASAFSCAGSLPTSFGLSAPCFSARSASNCFNCPNARSHCLLNRNDAFRVWQQPSQICVEIPSLSTAWKSIEMNFA